MSSTGPSARRSALARAFRARRGIERLPDPTPGRRRRRLEQDLDDAIEAYRALLPVVPLSRCCFCGEVLALSFDGEGLDGLWWDWECPIRADVERTCPHYFSMAGAVRLEGPVKAAPHVAKPGPEAPYVVPRVLAARSVQAVISSVRVGGHTGFPIAYFADPLPEDVEPVDAWGTNFSALTAPNGTVRVESALDPFPEFDFELRPWIASGRVRWIRPGDEQLRIESVVEGCPYLDLPGRREMVWIQRSRVWTLSDLRRGRTAR